MTRAEGVEDEDDDGAAMFVGWLVGVSCVIVTLILNGEYEFPRSVRGVGVWPIEPAENHNRFSAFILSLSFLHLST